MEIIKRYFDNMSFDDLYDIIKKKKINNKSLALKQYENFMILETICYMIISLEPYEIYKNKKYGTIYTHVINKEKDEIMVEEYDYDCNDCDFCENREVKALYVYYPCNQEILSGVCKDCMIEMIKFADDQSKEIIENILLKLLLLKETDVLKLLNYDVFYYIFKMIM